MPFKVKSLKILRERENISQRRLSALLGVMYNTVHRWENLSRYPSLEEIDKMYEFAHRKGYRDLVFYEPPRR